MQITNAAARALAAVIVVAAIVVIATSGESVAVRFLTGIVSADIAVRLAHWSPPVANPPEG